MKSRSERKSLREIIKIRNYYVFEAGQRETDDFLHSLQNCSEDLRPWVDCMTEFITYYRPKFAKKRRALRMLSQQRAMNMEQAYLKRNKRRVK